MRFKETQQRSTAKSITYRILVVISDMVVIYAITRHVGTTIALTIITNLASTVLYFIHERAWNDVSWGKKPIR